MTGYVAPESPREVWLKSCVEDSVERMVVWPPSWRVREVAWMRGRERRDMAVRSILR